GGDGTICIGGELQVQATPMENTQHHDLFGQFYTTSIPDQSSFIASYKFKFGLYPVLPTSASAGFSFRMVDAQNMYRVEYREDNKVSLVKIVNGKRTVLGEAPFQLKVGEYVSFSVRAVLDQIKVYVNNSPIIDVTDSTFTTGKFGPY